VATCPSCGEENPARFVLCGFCGTPLAESPRPSTEERKVVTVLFCDLVGFTARSDRADPEDVKATLRPFHTRLKHEIEAFGGTLDKFIGDAAFGVFGSPVVHEDDAERAVRAALAIRAAIAELNEADPSLDLAVRQGVNTGEAVVAYGTGPQIGEAVTGDMVNTASRLQSVAPVGGIAVGEATYKATKDLFVYEAREPVTVKGKSEPLRFWLAVEAIGRSGAETPRPHTTPFIGRELERNVLTGALERSIRDSSVQLLTIVGEPGVGKSRLAAELFAVVDGRADPVRWRRGRCLPYGEGVTFWALGEIVKAEAGILESDDPEAAAAKIDVVVSDDHPDAPWLRQRLRPLAGIEAPPAAREENFAAWRGFLESLAEERPSVFVFEDLHWADDAFLSFLEHLTGYAEGVPMLVVSTARPELLERRPGWAGGMRNAATVNLTPLSDPETARLIGNLLDQAVLPAEMLTSILARSGGNPLYAEEFVRLLMDRDILRKTGSTWTLDPSAEVPMPSGVQGLIAARLDTLAPERKRMLQDAAVVGTVFWSGAVAQMAGREPEEVAESLHELSRKELVRPARRSSMAGEAEYSFWHVLIRDVCYAQVPRARRAETHCRAAEWIEQVAPERLEDHAEILAAHYSTALGLAAAARGTDTAEISAKALQYLALAGDRALGIDLEAAERHYARALQLATEGHSKHPYLLASHAEALLQRGRFPEAALDYAEAVEGLRARGDVPATALALGRYAIVLMRLGDSRYRAAVADALALLEPRGPSPELAAALTEQAASSFVAGEHSDAVAVADRVIALSRELDLPEPARAWGFRGGSRVWLGDAGGVEDMRRAMRAAGAQGLVREVALLHANLAEALWPTKGPRSALEAFQEGAAFAERRGIEEFVLVFAASSLEAMVDLGYCREAIALAENLAPRLEQAEDIYDILWVRAAQVRLLTRQGDYAQAAAFAEVVRTREMGEPQPIAMTFPAVAALRLGLGDAPGALAILAELDQTRNVRAEARYAANLVDAVRTALGAGDVDLAARLAEDVEPIYPLHDHALVSVRALLAENRGTHADGADLFADAAGRWDGFEVPWEAAQARLGLARCLLALGRGREAGAPLKEARKIFRSLGAKPALAETEALIDRSVAHTS
jgi:class 3 adenylate cyclase/tetratricopeptide (TPR) repeat protein